MKCRRERGKNLSNFFPRSDFPLFFQTIKKRSVDVKVVESAVSVRKRERERESKRGRRKRRRRRRREYY